MITQDILVQSLRHVMSLDIHAREKLADEIFARQPNLLGTVLVLSNLHVPMEKIDEILFILLVLYEAFQKRSGKEIPLVTEEMIEKAHDNTMAMLKYLDKEGMQDGSALIARSIADSSHKFVTAFVLGHLNEHGFASHSTENEYCITAAKVILDCFIQASLPEKKQNPT